ncbi:helix-turn-helix domain-containing protein [Jeongeupia naejangsanensis]|uniref:Helix-turn-helix domain-containing protein n=1 Tax=Jeongeupia naejangsanensis TaxID=613195 RepID=A0ABS2BQI1_9NEIS|nr:helix-turn-helix domain-containing protein [Jeongeupia naejangsanensis]MBM3117887.1 helix-turn-helix domain-containing protein [Jeongeupia naejangsanensis]
MKKKNRLPASQCSRTRITAHSTQPIVTGQCAEVLELLRTSGSILSLELPSKYAIPQYNARIHDLRSFGFNVITHILPEVEFRGRIRRNVARYSLGSPEWRPTEGTQ